MYKSVLVNRRDSPARFPFGSGQYLIVPASQEKIIYSDSEADLYAPYERVIMDGQGEFEAIEREEFKMPDDVKDHLGRKKFPLWFYNISGKPSESIQIDTDFSVHVWRGIPKVSYIGIDNDLVLYKEWHIRPKKYLKQIMTLPGSVYEEIYQTAIIKVERGKKELDEINAIRAKHNLPELKKEQKKKPEFDPLPEKPKEPEGDLIYSPNSRTWRRKESFKSQAMAVVSKGIDPKLHRK